MAILTEKDSPVFLFTFFFDRTKVIKIDWQIIKVVLEEKYYRSYLKKVFGLLSYVV